VLAYHKCPGKGGATFLKVGVHPASEASRKFFSYPLFLASGGYNWKLENEKTITRNIVLKKPVA